MGHRFKAIEDFLSIRIINVSSKEPYYRFVQQQQEHETMIKNRKNITKFFESILCIKNDGTFKVIGVFGIKIKIRMKYKKLLYLIAEFRECFEQQQQQQLLQQQQQQLLQQQQQQLLQQQQQQQLLQQQQQQQLLQQQQQLLQQLLQQLVFFIHKKKGDV